MNLVVEGLTHRYTTEEAVSDVSFEVPSGDVVALLGPSGCGKTTIIQAIAGHIRPTAGRIFLGDEEITQLPPEAREIGVVFQESTLYPHMTVEENVAYGLIPLGLDADERTQRITANLDLVDLAPQRHAYPEELSGGQRRRAELARALAPRPGVLLLDEPLSSLDQALRDRLQDEIARIQRETGVTTLFVTHDQEEAMGLADRLVVMNDGRISGMGSPRELYESPPTPFVASFLGRSNPLPATVVEEQPLAVRLDGTTIALPSASGDFDCGSTVTCYIRPDTLSIRTVAEDGSSPLTGTVSRVTDYGRRYEVIVELGDGSELRVEQSAAPPSRGESVSVVVPEGGMAVFDTTLE